MSAFLPRVANIALAAIEFAAFFVLANGFFPFRRRRRQVLLLCAAGFLADYALLMMFERLLPVKLLAVWALLTLLLRVLCRARAAQCAVTALLYLSMVNVLDGTMLYLTAAATGPGFAAFLSDPYRYYLLAFCSKLAGLLIVALLRTWARGRFYRRAPSAMAYLRIGIFPLTVLIATLILLNASTDHPGAAPELLLCVAVLLAADLVSILLLDQFEEQQQALLDARLLQRELKLSREHTASLADSYAQERRLTHDFQNRLAVIRGLLEQEDGASETLAYVNELIGQETASVLAVSTHRTVADVVLNQKYLLALRKQIGFSVQLDDLAQFPLPDDGLVVVLSNLLDNAIEACEKIDDPKKRHIAVKARRLPEEWLLYVENTVAAPVKIEHGRVKTTKSDPGRHGFGLPNVRAIVRAHHGTCAIGCEGLRFSVVIHFTGAPPAAAE